MISSSLSFPKISSGLLRGSDRALPVRMSRLWPSLLDATQVVQPETILRWHRAGFKAFCAAHARVDGWTSLAVLFGSVGEWLGYPLADPTVGLLITAARSQNRNSRVRFHI